MTATTDTTWCVYLPEWVRVHVSVAHGQGGQEECKHVFTERFLRKVRQDDWRIRPDRGNPPRYRLELRLPNLKGEFKDDREARDLADRLGAEAILVEWGSAEEDRLMDYGQKRLNGARVA